MVGQTPRSILESRDVALRQQIQEDFKIEAGRLEQTPLTPEEFAKHRKKLHETFQDRYRKESQGLQAQIQGLSEIESLVSSGQATPQAGAEQGMRSVLDIEAERAMFPQQEQPISRQLTVQLSYRDELDNLLAQYEDQPGGKKTYWGLGKPTTAKLKVVSGGSKKDGYTFRDATPEETREYGYWRSERARATEAINVIMQGPDMSNRLRKAALSSGRKLGISESMAKELQNQKPSTPKTQEPKYQVNKATGQRRVSYDGGQTWQTL